MTASVFASGSIQFTLESLISSSDFRWEFRTYRATTPTFIPRVVFRGKAHDQRQCGKVRNNLSIEKKTNRKIEKIMSREISWKTRRTSHPRIANGQRYPMPCLEWLAAEVEWEQGSGPKGPMSCRTQGWISRNPEKANLRPLGATFLVFHWEH